MAAKPTDQSCMASLKLPSSLSKRQLVQIYSVFPPLGPWRYARANVLSIICRCPRLRVALLFTSCCQIKGVSVSKILCPNVLLWHARQRYNRRTCTLLAQASSHSLYGTDVTLSSIGTVLVRVLVHDPTCGSHCLNW